LPIEEGKGEWLTHVVVEHALSPKHLLDCLELQMAHVRGVSQCGRSCPLALQAIGRQILYWHEKKVEVRLHNH
jgi:hypothetical protein